MNTPLEYYDSQEYGSYQYVTLEEVVNNFMMSRDPDDNVALTPRYRVLYQAKRGLRELYFDVLKEIDSERITISPTLTIQLPHNYVRYVRISWIDDNNVLHPMAVDNSMSIAASYLQGNDYEILFDNDGHILTDNGNNSKPKESDKILRFCDTYIPNQDLSKVYNNGKFRIDNRTGLIHFSSDVESKDILIEYISDGLYTEYSENEIRIHKFAEQALIDYIFWKLISNRKNIPANRIMLARKEFFRSRKTAKRRLSNLTLENLKQIFKGDTKIIK